MLALSNLLDNSQYRETNRTKTRLRYWGIKPVNERCSPSLLQSDLVINVTIKDEKDIRFGQKIAIPVYKIGTLAHVLDMTTQGVKIWETRGWIPDGAFNLAIKGGQVRAYTFDQIYIAWVLSPLLSFSDKRGMEYSPFIRHLKKAWSNLNSGIQPMYEEDNG